ncbi:hypothetical protein F0562_023984 [Nyssa sinensis]|uniref:Serine-threonine/tyrosine-protein kinase catalytic domain-containing protein n=1 Tax=Nyssa sinensis TaxID=561372 RepID=A0A5J5BM82_9ASTE|nr:hypothetical protein F0562_023984 [Nyssa sinensis]
MGERVSTYGDVYSYGIILLAMFTGKRPTDDMFTNGLNLHNSVKMALPERVMEIVDPILLHTMDEEVTINHIHKEEIMCTIQECMISVFRVGVTCSTELPRERMDMNDVSRELRLKWRSSANNLRQWRRVHQRLLEALRHHNSRLRVHSAKSLVNLGLSVLSSRFQPSRFGLASDSPHPWPEWVTFVDGLKAKGYFVKSPQPSPPAAAAKDGDGDGEGGDSKGSDGAVYKDMTLLKDACLSFARDRFDIFK